MLQLKVKEKPQCQEPPSGKFTTTEEDYYHNNKNNRMWGQLSTTCSIATEGAQWGAPSCSRDGTLNYWPLHSTLHRAVPLELHVLHGTHVDTNHKTCGSQCGENTQPSECHSAATLGSDGFRIDSAVTIPKTISGIELNLL